MYLYIVPFYFSTSNGEESLNKNYGSPIIMDNGQIVILFVPRCFHDQLCQNLSKLHGGSLVMFKQRKNKQDVQYVNSLNQ